MSKHYKMPNGETAILPKEPVEISGYQPTAYTTDGPIGQPKRRGNT